MQLDPDDRPCFEEVVEILESIPIDVDDTAPTILAEQPTNSSFDDDTYLRSCFSEPYLKLADKTDSGGSSVHLGYQLDSMGSSTASTGSSCGSCTDNLTTAGQDNGISTEQATSNLELLVNKGLHKELKKTSSLAIPGSDANSPDLNCSIQTLIAAEDGQVNIDVKEFTNCGGDSGIDPGEMEVFKFPPHDSRSSKSSIGGAKLEKISNVGQIPHYSSPSHRVVFEASRNLTVTPEASSPHALSPVRTASDGSVSCTHTTPSSPYAQSWASSEFSFHLPNPSTPYAPPCTPIPRQRRANSCPSSPSDHPKPFRFSFDASHLQYSSVDSDSPASCHRRSKWASSKHSTNCSDQDSLDKDLEYALRRRKHSQNPNRRSVHFEENEICTNLDQEHFSKISLSRNRSHSNPTQPIMKLSTSKENSAIHSLTLADYEDNPTRSPNTALCKGYNVTMTINARLSSSVPNLFVR